MSSQRICDSEMNDAAAIRAVYPRHTMKLLALAMGVPLDTARHWLYRNLCAARRRELALALIAELDSQDAGRAAVRQRLTVMAGGADATLVRLPLGPPPHPDCTGAQTAAAEAPGEQAGAVEQRLTRRARRLAQWSAG
jgi:hypothetical protein